MAVVAADPSGETSEERALPGCLVSSRCRRRAPNCPSRPRYSCHRCRSEQICLACGYFPCWFLQDPVRGFSLAGGCSAPHCSASSSCSSCPRSALMAMQRTLRRWFAGYDCPTRWAEKDKVTAGEREHTCEENADDKIAQREGSVAGGKPLAQATGAASPSASEHEHAQGRSTAESAESTLRPEKDRKQQNAVTSSEGSLYRKLPLCALCVVICSVVVAIASQLHHVPVLRHG